MIRSGNRALSIVTVVLGVAMIGSGLSKLAGESHQVMSFALWGLPPWFRALVGTFEIVGALLLIVRATRPAGSLILSTIMVGALWAHLAHAEWSHLVPPGLLLAMFLTTFWRARSSAVRLLGAVALPAPDLHTAQTRDIVATNGKMALNGRRRRHGAAATAPWIGLRFSLRPRRRPGPAFYRVTPRA